MIVASRKRYLPVTTNTIVLSQADWYFYVHRDVYDQAVVLSDLHQHYEELLPFVMTSNKNEKAIEFFYLNAPKPINILAPFLGLVNGNIEEDIELCSGILHTITAMINTRNYIQKSAEIRKSVSFSLAIKEEYEIAWDRFFMTSIPIGIWKKIVKDAQQIKLNAETSKGNIKRTETKRKTSSSDTKTSAESTSKLEGLKLNKRVAKDHEFRSTTDTERKATRELLMQQKP